MGIFVVKNVVLTVEGGGLIVCVQRYFIVAKSGEFRWLFQNSIFSSLLILFNFLNNAGGKFRARSLRFIHKSIHWFQKPEIKARFLDGLLKWDQSWVVFALSVHFAEFLGGKHPHPWSVFESFGLTPLLLSERILLNLLIKLVEEVQMELGGIRFLLLRITLFEIRFFCECFFDDKLHDYTFGGWLKGRFLNLFSVYFYLIYPEIWQIVK